jgi:protocatechuate 3,4-dioxygenase, alpha subunit
MKTPSQTVGPFFSIGLDRRPEYELRAPGSPGAIALSGTLFDGEGAPITDGLVELWQAADGLWGRCRTGSAGTFAFVVGKPAAPPGQAPHLDVHVFARGLLKHQTTRVYFPDEAAANAADPVLSALGEVERAGLVAEREDGGLRFDIRMQGDRETVFFAT